MQIELYPLEKMVIDGKDIYLGCDRQTVTALLGNAEAVHEQYGGETQRHYYYNSELALDYGKNDRLEFIEFLGGHDGDLKPYIYGMSAFDTKREELVRILSEHNDVAVDDGEEDFYSFHGISVGVWAENDDDDYWMTIGIGVKEYY